MTKELKDHIDRIITDGVEKNHWFMTKQSLKDFYFLFFIAQIVERYPTEKYTHENFAKFYQRCFINDGYASTHFPNQCLSENTYRNAISAEFVGLFNRADSSARYDTGVVTDAYKTLKRFIRGPEDIEKYRYLLDRQIEKIAFNVNEHADIYDRIKENTVFPTIFLYRILFELKKEYGVSRLEWNEFLLFLTHAKKNSDWPKILQLIKDYRKARADGSITPDYEEKIQTILHDPNMDHIRYDELFNSMQHISCTGPDGCNIRDDRASLIYVESVLDMFEHSDYKNETNKTKIRDFMRSDKYFIGYMENISVVKESTTSEDDEKTEEAMKQLFIAWLKNKGYKPSSIKKYLSAVNVVSSQLKTNLYLVTSLTDLLKLHAIYMADEELMKKDKKVKLANSCGFERYIEFYKDFVKGGIQMEFKERGPRTGKINPLNQIIYGAPGTGKTYSTPEYAVSIIENRLPRETLSDSDRTALITKYQNLVKEGRIVFTTFHQSYGYEDFIEGLRPIPGSKNLLFQVNDGVFKDIAKKAAVDPEKDYVIIIDEINRGNISKIFGELITLIEEDKRYGEKNCIFAKLPYGDDFAVPNNLYIVGTMNSADKSISLIDAALRRRFIFIEKSPNIDLISDADLKEVLKKLNEYLYNTKKTTDLLIGHSYFIGKAKADIPSIMNKSIVPLLYEYFYDDENEVKKALDECLKDTGFAAKVQKTARIIVE